MRRTDHRDQPKVAVTDGTKSNTQSVLGVPASEADETPAFIDDLKPRAKKPPAGQAYGFSLPAKTDIPSPDRPVVPQTSNVRRNRRWLPVMASVFVLALIIGGWVLVQPMKNVNVVASDKQSSSQPATKFKVQSSATQLNQEASVITTSFAKAPDGIKTAVLEVMRRDFSNCVNGTAIIDKNGNPYNPVIDYTASGFARVPLGCQDGATYLLVNPGEQWMDVESTRDLHDCDVVEFYKVPKNILERGDSSGEAKCLTGGTVRSYL